MKKETTILLYVLTLSLVLFGGKALSQSDTRAEVMILGSHHMHNPGADVFNVETDDVLKPERQAQISEVVQMLSEFKPTMVALEIKRGSKRDTSEQNNYRAYLKGDFELTRWEGHQIGFRIAKNFDHQEIYNIDETGDFPFQKMMDWAQENKQTSWLEATMKKMETRTQREGQDMAARSIAQQLFEMNQKSTIQEGHGIYVAGSQIGKHDEFPGTDVLTEWYKRNARIFTNLYRITEGKTGERILVIFGAGHAHILRELVRLAPEFKLLEPTDYLTSSKVEHSFLPLLEFHLGAVMAKDSLALKSTLNMDGAYHLILPDGSQMHTARDFYKMHVEWFKDEQWTMEMKVLESSVHADVGTAFVQADYREPDRDGKPYHHKMWITYFCEKIGDIWKVVHDHCTTAEKSH